jgi:hypothetical protein
VVPFDELEAMTDKYALACSRTRPTDTVFAQKTFFEIYKQHQGEYMGSIVAGLLESTLDQLRPDPDTRGMELDEDTLDNLTDTARDNDEQFPPGLATEPTGPGRQVAARESRKVATVLVITNAKVFDGRKMLPGRHSVTLDGSVISAIDDASPVTPNAMVDAAGMTLIPGLISSHLHADFYKFNIADSDRLGKERPPGVLMAIGVRT